GGSILTSSLDRTALLWPAAKIGPSLKLSSARLEIPRAVGAHVIDPAAQLLDPDMADLSGSTLRAWLKAMPGASDIVLEIAAADLEVAQNQIVLVAGGERRPLAERVESNAQGAVLEFRLLKGAAPRDAERLLRSIALRVK